jgi:hypothetical protein
MRGNVVLTDDAFRTLQRTVQAQKLELTNLRRRMATRAVRRHEGNGRPNTAVEEAILYTVSTQTGISTTEISSGSFVLNSGQITGIATGGLGSNPSGYAKFLRADTAQRLYFHFCCYFHKDTATAGVATCVCSVKRWNSSDVLQQTEDGFCDVPTLSAATSGMSLGFQSRLTMAANDYVTVTFFFFGGYTSTIAVERGSIYFRPIRT